MSQLFATKIELLTITRTKYTDVNVSSCGDNTLGRALRRHEKSHYYHHHLLLHLTLSSKDPLYKSATVQKYSSNEIRLFRLISKISNKRGIIRSYTELRFFASYIHENTNRGYQITRTIIKSLRVISLECPWLHRVKSIHEYTIPTTRIRTYIAN